MAFKVILDTNILLVSISSKSRLHWIFTSLLDARYELFVTTDILSEYAEILDRHMGRDASEYVMATLENLDNINLVSNYFRFRLLLDEDDNKFVDCAIASNADFIVSHDKDFNVLASIDFPKVRVINVGDFEKILNKDTI